MNNKGFTLVEVIVVAVIVAILAVSSMQLYIGYVNDARKQVLEGVAGNAATYLNAARNLDVDVGAFDDSLTSDEQWVTPTGGTTATFSPPVGVAVRIIDDSAVQAFYKDDMSSLVLFR